MDTVDAHAWLSRHFSYPVFSRTEVKVVEALKALDVARIRVQTLSNVFVGLIARRYPIGSVVDLNTVTVGSHDGTHARVRRVKEPTVCLIQPENTRVTVECVLLGTDGRETSTLVHFHERLLGNAYEQGLEKEYVTPRERLLQLVHELEADHAATYEAGPSK